VGDRVGSDILGAKNAGMASALVTTGEFRPGDELGPVFADHVLRAITEILELF
jgi:ribonucleotide monophosphatase NagD (HAD superfamily)